MTNNELVYPTDPLKIALIGTGGRARGQYCPIFKFLQAWVEVVAVCDPVRKNCDQAAEMLNVTAYYDIHQLVKDKPMEAALVVTPVPSHHSISVYLSSHGIHNMCETTWCNTLGQARQMIETAKDNKVIVRVAENFFRFSIDRFAQILRDSDYLGSIQRIFSYNDHTGYHNNSRWIAFAQSHPLWVQSIEHSMPTISFYSSPQRFHRNENFRARYFGFNQNLLVVDSASNIKGFLGRQSRPGHTEWQGESGTLLYRPETAELRYCSENNQQSQYDLPGKGGGRADRVYPVVKEIGEDGQWLRTYCQTDDTLIEYLNPYRLYGYREKSIGYSCAIADHISDFCLSVRGLRQSEFDEQDALMSLMMEIGAQESALNQGERIQLPVVGETEAEAKTYQALKQQYCVDPMDIEAMLDISYPKP